MRNQTVQRTWLYILIALYIVASFLFVNSIIKYGNGNAAGPLATSVVIGIFFIPLARGYTWAKWTLIIIFVALAIRSYLVYMRHPNSDVIALIGSYLLLGFVTNRFKGRQNPDDLMISQEDILDSSFIQEYEEEADDKKESAYRYPVLLTRYKALLIDGSIFLITMILVMVVLGDSEYRSYVMISLWASFLFLYEPLLTTYSATVGQRVMKTRVRSHDDPSRRIQLWQAYLRIVTKVTLGWISALSMLTNEERRAIHDLIARSVVIEDEKADASQP